MVDEVKVVEENKKKYGTSADFNRIKGEVLDHYGESRRLFVEVQSEFIRGREIPLSAGDFIGSVSGLFLDLGDKIPEVKLDKYKPLLDMNEEFENISKYSDGITRVRINKYCKRFRLLRSLMEELGYTQVERKFTELVPEQINKEVLDDRLRLMG